MLGWLFPRPPVRVQEKAWIEYRFAWLLEQLGARRLLDAQMIEPTDEFFPGEYRGTPADAEVMYRRVCKFMGVNPAEMELEVLPADDMPSAGGHYDRTEPTKKPALRVSDAKIVDPEALVATLAHEVAHHILLGGGLMTGEEPDHELTTDLLPCVLGLGIFTANSTVRTAGGSSGTWHWWSFQRNGYMPSQGIGYALAIFAWLRDERSPKWKRHLRLDAREPLVAGLRYLRRTSDCYVTPETLGATRRPSTSELMHKMEDAKPAARIQVLWDAAKHPSGTSLAESVKQRLRDADAAVRIAAIGTVAQLEVNDSETIHEIDLALEDENFEVRAAAARALGILLPEDSNVVVDLGFALEDQSLTVVAATAEALRNYGPRAAPAEKNMLMALRSAYIDCTYDTFDLLIKAIRAASPDPGQSINDYFRERDPEFRQMAIDALYADHD